MEIFNQYVKFINILNWPIGDDDSTTMAMVRQQVPHNVEKWSDVNHAKKALGTRLYNLQKKDKALTSNIIKYLQKCFSYAISQNKNDPQGLYFLLTVITIII